MDRRRTTLVAARLYLIAGVAVIGLLCNANAWAQTTTTTTTKHHHKTVTKTVTTTTVVASTSEQQRLDALSGQMSNLQKQSDDTTSEVKKIEAAMTVAVPAQADAKPATIGEHVGLVEKDVSDIKKNLSDNLGISVHALVDAGYEHNFNQPNGNFNVVPRLGRGWIPAYAGQPAYRARRDGWIRDRPQLRPGRELDFDRHALLEHLDGWSSMV